MLNLFFKIQRYGLGAVLFMLIIFPVFIYGAETETALSVDKIYLEELIKKGDDLKLYDDPYWHMVMHYKKVLTGYKSRVTDPGYFFSEKGRRDPKAELESTLRAFFTDYEKGKIHPTAKYALRFNWLSEKLNIDHTRLPYDGDTAFNAFYNTINPSTVSLVFPTGYMSSPASMFGHTLILVDTEGESRIVSHSINYAAQTDDSFGPVFAFRGLFGLYRGYYSFLPYYKKIQEYSDSEMRDIWEYELSMSPEGKRKLLRYVVEMEDIYSDYYFIDENCSFNLLYLIEAAEPGSNLTGSFSAGVEPVDIVRLVKKRGLVVKRIYRPSLYSRIMYMKSLLTEDEQSFVLDLCSGKKSFTEIGSLQSGEEKKILICELSTDYLKFLAVKKKIEINDYKARYMAVLTQRNLLGKYDPFKDMPEPVSPENSHLSKDLAPESGYGLNGWYSQLSYRHTAHELMDRDEGYNLNSQVIFGKIAARYYYDDKKFLLQRFDIIDILSIPRSNSFYICQGYQFNTGFNQDVIKEKRETLTYQIKGASGLSTTVFSDLAQVYLFGGVKSNFSPEYEYNTDLSVTAETGLITILGLWKNHIYGRVYYAPFWNNHTRSSAGACERFSITDTVSIMADYSFNRDYNFTWHEYSAKVNFYF